jgi:hypothetical protein
MGLIRSALVVGGVVLAALALATRWPWQIAGLGIALLAAGLLLPVLSRARTGRRQRREENRFRRLIEKGWSPCPLCDGSGKFSTPAGYLGAPVFHVCATCRGEGMLPPA